MALTDKLTAIADAIREKTGDTDPMTLSEMVTAIGGISGGGIDTSDATATESDLLSGKTAYVGGVKVTGTHVCEEGLDTSDATATASEILEGYTAYAGGEMITGTIAAVTPSVSYVSVDASTGNITANARCVKGYVKETINHQKTLQMDTVAAATYTPGTADQTIAAGQFLTGEQTIQGDANLIAGNIKSGVSIFGVAGTYEGSGGVGSGIQAQHITSASDTITISGTGTVQVWGYGYYSSGTYSKTTYAFVGDGYYTASYSGTPSKTSATFSVGDDGTLSGLPSSLTTLDVLVTIGEID